jgi:hypothetical protein
METVKGVQKTLCSHAMLGAVAGAVLLLLIGEKAFAKGLVLGTLFSVVNFVLMGQFLPRQMAGSRTRASAAALGSIVIRFTLLAIPLVVSLRVDSVHFIAVVIGLFMVQLTMLFDLFVRRRFSSVRNT